MTGSNWTCLQAIGDEPKFVSSEPASFDEAISRSAEENAPLERITSTEEYFAFRSLGVDIRTDCQPWQGIRSFSALDFNDPKTYKFLESFENTSFLEEKRAHSNSLIFFQSCHNSLCHVWIKFGWKQSV